MRQRQRSGWGAVVRRVREERGWTQAQLAQRAGVDQSQVSKIEAGSREGATFETVGKIADALGVGTDYLRGRPTAGLPVADLADALVERMRAAQSPPGDGAGVLSSTDYTNLKGVAAARVDAHLAGALAS